MDWFKIHCCGVVRQYYKNVVTLHIFLDIALYLPPYCNKLFDPNLTHEHPDKAFYLKKKWVFPHCSTNWPIRPNLIVRLIPLFPFYRLDSTLSWSFSFANEYSVWVDGWGGGWAMWQKLPLCNMYSTQTKQWRMSRRWYTAPLTFLFVRLRKPRCWVLCCPFPHFQVSNMEVLIFAVYWCHIFRSTQVAWNASRVGTKQSIWYTT